MNEFPVVESLYLDPLPTANMIEAVVGEYLVAPTPGIYFRGKTQPVMVPDAVYHQHRNEQGVKSKSTYVVTQIEELDRHYPVMNLDGEVVVTPNQIPFLSNTATQPVVAAEIVRAAIDEVVKQYGHLLPARTHRQLDPCEVYRRFLYAPKSEPGEDPSLYLAAIDQITGIVGDIRARVRNYCGDDKHIAHFVQSRHGFIVIEKSIDARIMEYHRFSRTKYER